MDMKNERQSFFQKLFRQICIICQSKNIVIQVAIVLLFSHSLSITVLSPCGRTMGVNLAMPFKIRIIMFPYDV